MSASRKPRPDSRLKLLPEKKQAEIMEMLRRTSLRAAVGVLAKQGIKTSKTALGAFFTWWNDQHHEELLLERCAKHVDKLRKENPNITKAELERQVYETFSVMAMTMAKESMYSGRSSDASILWARLNTRILEGNKRL